MLEYSFDRPDLNASIEKAVAAALGSGNRSPDLGGAATTDQVTGSILAALRDEY